MKIIYEAHVGLKATDFDDEAAARKSVEAHGSGYVVTFVRGFDNRDRSSAMNVFKDGAWNGVNIHE